MRKEALLGGAQKSSRGLVSQKKLCRKKREALDLFLIFKIVFFIFKTLL